MSKLGKNGSTVLKIMQTVPNFPQIIHPRKLLENDGEFFFSFKSCKMLKKKLRGQTQTIEVSSQAAQEHSTQVHRIIEALVERLRAGKLNK